jgi:GDPmannose 4,6-dehydratase
MTKALITGICGQDGAYLAKHLLDKGYEVYGIARRNSPMDNLVYVFGCTNFNVNILFADIIDPHAIDDIISKIKPDEIYNLAAQSHVGMSFKNPSVTCAVNYTGYLNVLLSARRHAPRARIYQAGSSEMFGYAGNGLSSETTPLQPMSPYAISKVASHWAGVNARHEANQFVCNGILFNHESPCRGDDFVTRKITKYVAKYDLCDVYVLRMGNLNSMRDWGYAGDYVQAMHAMLQHDKPDDYVVATGSCTSVRDFIRTAFACIGKDIKFSGSDLDEVGMVDGRVVVCVDKEFYRPNDLTYLRGDSSKIKNVLGWRPSKSLSDLVSMMVARDLKLLCV